jgi:hypothetical protein
MQLQKDLLDVRCVGISKVPPDRVSARTRCCFTDSSVSTVPNPVTHWRDQTIERWGLDPAVTTPTVSQHKIASYQCSLLLADELIRSQLITFIFPMAHGSAPALIHWRITSMSD